MLRIPEAHREHVRHLIDLEPAQRQQLLETLRELGPSVAPGTLGRSVAKATDIPVPLTTGFITVLGVLYLLQGDGERTAQQVGEYLADAAEEAELASWDPETRSQFVDFVTEALALHGVIGVTAKALDILLQDANSYSSARIITNFRPVFLDEGEGLTPSAGMIVHDLKLVSYTDTEEKSHFVALDTFDLRELRSVIDRALQKEDALRNLLARAGVNCIDRGII